MPNNPINKVVFDGRTLIDLTDTTATADKIKTGYGAYGADGVWMDGTAATGGENGDVYQDEDGYLVLAPGPGTNVTVTSVAFSVNGVFSAPSGTAYSPVTVSVGPARSLSDITVSGSIVSGPAGLYSEAFSKAVSAGRLKVSLSEEFAPNMYINSATGMIGALGNGMNVNDVANSGTFGYVDSATSSAQVTLNWKVSSSMALPTLAATTYTPTETSQTINRYQWLTGSQTIAAISSSYVGTGVARRSAADIYQSGVNVYAPSGYYSFTEVFQIPTTNHLDPALTFVSSTGYIQAIHDAEDAIINNKIMRGKYGTSSSMTLPVFAATTWTPSSTNQYISSYQWLTGSQTILGDANLVPSNIASGVSIFGVTGTHKGGGTNSALTVTPTQSQQIFNNPGTGYDGYLPVTVEAIPSSYVSDPYYPVYKSLAYRSTINVSNKLEAINYFNTISKVNQYQFAGQAIVNTGTNYVSFDNVSEIALYGFAMPYTNVIGGFPSERFSFLNCSRINTGAFAYRTQVTEISFPSCTYIGEYAFFRCSGLSEVNFPICETVDASAFGSCTKLVSAIFPSCISIMTGAFGSCTKLSDISFPACTKIGPIAFQQCSSISIASFPLCTEISYSAFYSCNRLTEVNFPSCITIGSGAFSACSSLVNISFPICETIEKSAFYGCIKLESAIFPSCTLISSTAFWYCSSLISISFPECSAIYNSAFTSCTLIESAIFPKCTSIGESAFYNCKAMSIASFPECIYVGLNAFYMCSSLSTINFPICETLYSNAFAFCSSLVSVNFPSVVSINQYALSRCTKMTTVYLGKNADSTKSLFIGPNTFVSNYNLLSLYLLASSIYALNGINAFNSTPISFYTTSTGGVYGSIFVRASLYDAYKTATNWATYSARFVSLTDVEIANLPI